MTLFTMNDKVFFYTYFLFYAVAVEQHVVYGGTITAAATTVTVNFQSTLKLEWTAIPSPAEQIVVLKVFILPDTNNGVLTNTNPPVLLPTGMSLFGRNRLSATFINSKYTLMLKNVTYNDSCTFQMYAIFRKPAAYSVYQVNRSNIKVIVTGVPRVCGKGLASKIIIAEKESLTITQDICGHPKPDFKWKFKGDKIWRILLCSTILDDATKQYRHEFKTRPLTRADCGKTIIFNASNELGSLAGETSVDVMFTPSTVSIKSLYSTSLNCIHATWTREDTGNCVVNYHLQFNSRNDIYSTSKSYFTICNLRSRPAFDTIWASYKGLLGKKHSSSTTGTVPKTTTTTTKVVIRTPSCLSYYLTNCTVNDETISDTASTLDIVYNTTLKLDWNMTLSAGEVIVGVQVYVLPDTTNRIITDTSPTVLSKGISIFGENRLSATFTNSRYRLMLRNIRYNESFTFQLYVIYGAGDHLSSSRFNIQVTVKGTPKICGVRLKSNYTVVENSTITFTQDVCAHPKPVAEWKLDQEKLYKKPSNTSLINTEQRKYRFTYQTRKLTRNDCGAKFILKATNAMGSVEETVKVDVIFKPPAVFIKSISRHNASCVKILWQREKMGNCILSYQLQFDGNSEIFFTSNTYFTMCTQLNITSVGIWATHKGEIGDITVDRISPATPAPETKEISADESKLTIKLIVILVIGSFVFTVILNVIFFGILLRKGFVILNFKTKKQHQNVANKNAEEYEVMGTTISNYTDINLHAIKPSVYADLKTTTDDSNQYAEIELNDVK